MWLTNSWYSSMKMSKNAIFFREVKITQKFYFFKLFIYFFWYSRDRFFRFFFCRILMLDKKSLFFFLVFQFAGSLSFLGSERSLVFWRRRSSLSSLTYYRSFPQVRRFPQWSKAVALRPFFQEEVHENIKKWFEKRLFETVLCEM